MGWLQFPIAIRHLMVVDKFLLWPTISPPWQRQNLPKLSSWWKIEKIKGTLLSQTLKVEGNKCPLILWSLFLIIYQPRQKGYISSSEPALKKTEGTLFSQTLSI